VQARQGRFPDFGQFHERSAQFDHDHPLRC
jgi:hypothetical protein